MDLEILKEIGMTNGEIRVYLALLDLRSSSTGQIINKSKITSSKVYLILERLEQKGLISHIIKNNVKYFQVGDPKRLLDYMEEKKAIVDKETDEIKKLIPFLREKRENFTNLQDTSMYQGFRGLQTALYEFISDLKKEDEYVVLGARGHFGESFENFIRNFYKEKEERGINTRLIYNSAFKEAKNLYKGLKLTKIRFIDHINPGTIVIAKDKVLIITYGEDSIQVLIKSPQIAESFYAFFESMWKIAKP